MPTWIAWCLFLEHAPFALKTAANNSQGLAAWVQAFGVTGAILAAVNQARQPGLTEERHAHKHAYLQRYVVAGRTAADLVRNLTKDGQTASEEDSRAFAARLAPFRTMLRAISERLPPVPARMRLSGTEVRLRDAVHEALINAADVADRCAAPGGPDDHTLRVLMIDVGSLNAPAHRLAEYLSLDT